ncbi:hypothetical protein FQN50_005709 [Emmonsiellopsis sp. PD_5]|nr:hypothetical protein FQN50_005709 [Emmonsiellopsis sp. PD_5]
MARLFDLPPELIIQIGKCLSYDAQKDVAVMLRTCRRFARLLTHVLYDPHLDRWSPRIVFSIMGKKKVLGHALIDCLGEYMARWKSDYIIGYFEALSLEATSREIYWQSTWLHVATGVGNLAIIKILLAKGADVNAADKSGQTPLSRSISHGDESIVRLLLEAGGDPLVRDKETGCFHLLLEAANCSKVMMEFCLRVVEDAAGSKVDLTAKDNIAIFERACQGCPPLVKWLLELGVNPMNDFGKSATFAASYRQPESLRLIMDRVKIPGSDDWPDGIMNALPVAISSDYEDIVQIFCDYKFDFLASTGRDRAQIDFDQIYLEQSNFDFALCRGARSIVEMMMASRPELRRASHFQEPIQRFIKGDLGYNPGFVDILVSLYRTGKVPLDLSYQNENHRNYTLIHSIAAYRTTSSRFDMGWVDALDQLVNEPTVDLGSLCIYGDTALHIALEKRELRFAEAILDACIHRAPELLHLPNRHGITPLCLASKSVSTSIVTKLLEAGADVDRPDPLARTPLINAVVGNNDQIVGILINAGANVNATDTRKYSPLHFATDPGRPTIVRQLLAAGADPNARNNRRCTPLSFAASLQRYSAEIIEQLVAAGADINATDMNGRTALHWVTGLQRNSASCGTVRCLVNLGADIRIQDYEGIPPQHFSARTRIGIRHWDQYDDGKGPWHPGCEMCGEAPFPAGYVDERDEEGEEEGAESSSSGGYWGPDVGIADSEVDSGSGYEYPSSGSF